MSRAKGNLAEDKAAAFLNRNNFRILARNFYTRFGEIDIIATKKDVLHFVEVKSGSSFEPIYAITPKKLERILKSVHIYLNATQSSQRYCIDALLVRGENCELVENITF